MSTIDDFVSDGEEDGEEMKNRSLRHIRFLPVVREDEEMYMKTVEALYGEMRSICDAVQYSQRETVKRWCKELHQAPLAIGLGEYFSSDAQEILQRTREAMEYFLDERWLKNAETALDLLGDDALFPDDSGIDLYSLEDSDIDLPSLEDSGIQLRDPEKTGKDDSWIEL